MSDAMDPYDGGLAPPPFGLNNTGVICYLNSFLQMLAGCTSMARKILQNEEYLAKTETGRAMYNFFSAFTYLAVDNNYYARDVAEREIALLSSRVLSALMRD